MVSIPIVCALNGREWKRREEENSIFISLLLKKKREEDFHFASFEERLPTRLGGAYKGGDFGVFMPLSLCATSHRPRAKEGASSKKGS